MNSSYVLIYTTPSARLGNGGMHPIGCLGNYIFFERTEIRYADIFQIFLLCFLLKYF